MLGSVKFAIKHPYELLLKIREMRREREYEAKKIKSVDYMSLISKSPSIHLSDFSTRDGNLSSYELLVMMTLIHEAEPKKLLELGTFDGNTTLQMALNTSDDAQIETLDLPFGDITSELDSKEMSYALDEAKRKRKFEGYAVGKKINQHFGDSLTYDFRKFGSPDFVFIDACHKYLYVKNDTEKVLDILASEGIIIWHDYSRGWQDVFRYLNELSHKINLVHIQDTNFVYYKKEN